MSTTTQYRICGAAGAGYSVVMIWDAGEQKWIESDRDDGRCAFATRAEAEGQLVEARRDADVSEVEICEDTYENED